MAKKTLHPVEKARKEARKRELKKNKLQRMIATAHKRKEPEPSKLKQASEKTVTKIPPKSSAIIKPPAKIATNTDNTLPCASSSQSTIPTEANKATVIESKPIIYMPKATMFVPTSVRVKAKVLQTNVAEQTK